MTRVPSRYFFYCTNVFVVIILIKTIMLQFFSYIKKSYSLESLVIHSTCIMEQQT